MIYRRLKRLEEASGFALPLLLSFIIAMLILTGAVLQVIDTNFFVVSNNSQRQQAFNIAEAGVNYYLWHLSHNATDFKDGQTTPTTPDPNLGYGPYVHQYIDSNAINQGTYTLWIKPQSNGSTIATIHSIGQIKNSNVARTLDAKIGAASFASYGLVADVEFWFGNNESANGPVFSNQGVHMDGANSDTVGSANASYVPQSQYGGDGASHPGVWCSPSVTTPINCNSRDKSNWLYPRPAVDFNQIAGALCNMKKVAFSSDPSTAALANQANACSQTPATRTPAYIPQRSGSFSSSVGYLIQLNPSGTYDLYNVNAENDTKTSYSSALTLQPVATGITIPSAGVIFTEDNVWVRSNPTYHGRVSIAAGRLASSSQPTDINIVDNLLYSTKNGQDVIGLIAQNNVIITPYAPPSTGAFNFEVDAAALAQSGSVTWPQAYKSSGQCTRGWVNANQTLTFYGSVATRLDWTWNYQYPSCGDNVYDPVSGSYIDGIEHTATNYDYNLLYAPPPSYPTSGGFNILSWREVLNIP